MKNVLKLFKLQIDESNNLFKLNDKKKFLFTLLKYISVIFALTVVLQMLGINVVLLGIRVNTELLALILLVTQIISLVFAIGNVISVLFISKNNELLLSLPVSPNQIFLSKILVIYIKETIINAILCLPLMLVCGLLGLMPTIYYYFIPLFLLLLPILPLSIAVFLSIPAMKVIKFFKKHLLLSVITLFATIIIAIFLYVNLLTLLSSSFNIATKIKETVDAINRGVISLANSSGIYLNLAQSMTSLDMYYWILIFVGISTVCFVGAVLLIRPFFIKTAMDGRDNSTRVSKKQKPYKKQPVFVSLVKKEVLSVFRSPGYIFQYFLFTILMPIIVVLYDQLLLTLVVNQTGKMLIASAHVLIVAILAMLSNIISASAISREGANFYLMKTIPINYYTQTLAKVVFNAMFTCISIFITGIVSLFWVSPTIAIFTSISVMLVAIGHICQSYDFDLKNPTLDWYDNTEISSVSGNTTKSIVWGIVLAMLMGMVIMLLSATNMTVLPWIVLLVLSLAFCLHKVYILILRVYNQYDKLEM